MSLSDRISASELDEGEDWGMEKRRGSNSVVTSWTGTGHRRAVRRRSSFCVAAVLLAAVALAPAAASATGQTKLTASAGTANAKFGTSVSISEDTAVVGAPDEGG